MMHPLRHPYRFGLLVGLVPALHAAPTHAQTTLRYQFKQGEKFHCVDEMKTETQMTLGDKDFTTKSTFTYEMTWTVTAVGRDGKAKLVQTLDRIRHVQDGPQGKSEFDSGKAEEPKDPLARPCCRSTRR